MDLGPLIESLDHDGFGHWLAGFIDGEGSFIVNKQDQGWRCVMRIKLRDDDAAILYECQRRTGLGTVFPEKVYGVGTRATRNARPQMAWSVQSQADVAKLVIVLQCFPLRAKKRADFEVWRLAVREWITKRRHGRWEMIEAPRHQLNAVRAYESLAGVDEEDVANVLYLQPRLEGL